MNIYVGDLPMGLTEDELRQEFMTFGEVQSVTIMNTAQMRVYAFVEMASKSGAEAAIGGLSGKMIRGKPVYVVGALPLSKNGSTSSRGMSSFGRKGGRFIGA